MISLEDILAEMAGKEMLSIEGATDSFVEFIDSLDIDHDLKLKILFRFNNAISESSARGISQALAKATGIDEDSIYQSCIKHYEENLMKIALKATTRRMEEDAKTV